MTIVATEDTRNAAWASDKSSFGRRMLAKMGWSEGKGLGKEQQGQTTHLRAVRRSESLGIGAETDTHGEKGWNETSQNFHGVLAALKATHSSSSVGDDSDSARDKKRDKKKHRGKREKDESKKKRKKRLERKGSGLVLAQNKVSAGHARKMRDAKDLANKSAADMAAVFGVKVDEYEQKERSDRVTKFTASSSSSDAVSSSLVVESRETEERFVKKVRVSKTSAGATNESVDMSSNERSKNKSKKKKCKSDKKKASKKEKKRKNKESSDSSSFDEGRDRKSKKRRTK